MGWYVALGLLVLLAVLPLGISVQYDAGGFQARVIVGPLRFGFGSKGKKIAKNKESEQASHPNSDGTKLRKQSENGGNLTDFLPLAKLALRFLRDIRRKLRVELLEVKLILAGEDPCDLAVNYGRTCAAVGSVIPELERAFKIRKRNIEVQCDFQEVQTTVFARLDVTITLGRLAVLTVAYGSRSLREYFKITNKRKGGAEK